MQIELFFESLTCFFDTIRFLKTNKLSFLEKEESIIIPLDREVLSKVEYNYAKIL